MRRVLGSVLVGLGVFLLLVGVLAKYKIYPDLAVAPLSPKTNSHGCNRADIKYAVTCSYGSNVNIFSVKDLQNVQTPLLSTRNTLGQVKRSKEISAKTGRRLAVYDTVKYTQLAPNGDTYQNGDNTVISVTWDRVTFDRKTGEVYHCPKKWESICDEKTGGSLKSDVDPNDKSAALDPANIDFRTVASGAFSGFSGHYFKLPFNLLKKTYSWWDGDVGKGTPARYVDTEKLDGLRVYKFVQEIKPTDTGTTEVPASVLHDVPGKGNVTVHKIYSNTRTLWFEPQTGALIKGTEQPKSVYQYEGRNVLTTTDGGLGYVATTVRGNVDEYKTLSSELKLVKVWVPLLGIVLGVLLILVGVAYTVWAYRADRPRRAHSLETLGSRSLT